MYRYRKPRQYIPRRRARRGYARRAMTITSDQMFEGIGVVLGALQEAWGTSALLPFKIKEYNIVNRYFENATPEDYADIGKEAFEGSKESWDRIQAFAKDGAQKTIEMRKAIEKEIQEWSF